MEAIGFIAKFNRVSLPSNLRVTVYKSESLGKIKDIFSNNRTRDVVSLSIIFASNLCVVYGLTIYLPLALTSDICGVGGVNSTDIVHTCTKVTTADLTSLSVISLSGFVGTILGAVLSAGVGRLWPTRISCLIQIGVIFLLFFCFHVTTIILSAAFFWTGIVNCIEWIFVTEIFPTKIRATSISVVNSFGKLGGIIGSSLV